MKPLLLVLCICTTFFAFSQTYQTYTVAPERSVRLSSFGRSLLGAKSKSYVEINLPANTVQWVYGFTVVRQDNPSPQKLNLTSKIAKLVTSSSAQGMAVSLASDAINSLKIMAEYTPKALDGGHTAAEWKEYEKSVYTACFKEIMPQKTPVQVQAETNGVNGWKAYVAGDINSAISYSKDALAYDNTLGWVKANLGLCYLINVNQNAANVFYAQALEDIKTMPLNTSIKNYLQAVIDHINGAIQNYPSIQGTSSIISKYQAELANYQMPVPLFSN